MKLFLFFGIIYLAACNGNKQHAEVPKSTPLYGEFRLRLNPDSSSEWIINIPQGYTIEDSATYMDRLAHTHYQHPNPGEKSYTLLYVYEPGSLDDTIHYALSLSAFPWNDTTNFERYLKTGVDYMLRTINLDSSFQYLLRHRTIPDTIGGQPFMVENYDVLRGRDTVLFRYYIGIRKGRLLETYLHYYKMAAMGDRLKKAMENSVFK